MNISPKFHGNNLFISVDTAAEQSGGATGGLRDSPYHKPIYLKFSNIRLVIKRPVVLSLCNQPTVQEGKC